MSAPGGGHRPVLLDRVLALLGPALDRAGAVLVDATLGRAGHAQALLDAHPGLMLIGLDTDAAAVAESGRLLARYGDRVTAARRTVSFSTWGCPRRNSTSGRGASPTPMTPRWTCG